MRVLLKMAFIRSFSELSFAICLLEDIGGALEANGFPSRRVSAACKACSRGLWISLACT